mgnify:CR=1 FL=1
MHSEVSVSWGEAAIYRFDLEEQPPMTHEAARAWLDEQFTTLDCEPLRASGTEPLGSTPQQLAEAVEAASTAWA